MEKKPSEFVLYNKIIIYEKYLRRYVISYIPSIDRDIRIHILDESYNLLKYSLQARNNKGNIRNKYLNEMIVTIQLLEYLISEVIESNKNAKKKCITLISYLTEIKNIIYAWKSSEEYEKNKSHL